MCASPSEKSSSEAGKNNLLRGSRNLAASTMVSRLLGFFREMLTASALGAGMQMSAWVLAITLPNLFRRILGEGALGTALIPMMVHSIGNEGETRARERFTTIFLYLALLLGVISLLVAVPAFIVARMLEPGRWQLAAYLTPFVMPYGIFICCVGVLTSYANSLRVYFLPSLAAILQNVVLIGALYLVFKGWYPGNGDAAPLVLLSFAEILSGVLELLLMLWIIRRKKMAMVFRKSVWTDFGTIGSIIKLALPGMIGASAVQLSLIVDRCVAGFLSDYAPSALYYSERLTYLPIGVFAFAFGTVSLSEMSRKAMQKDFREMIGMMMFSMRSLLFVTVPIALFMLLECEDLIRLFYMRGKFDAEALAQTALAMRFYVLGIPCFAAYKISVAGFTARKNMVTPLKVSLITVSLNILLNLALMFPLRQGGIALATTVSSLAGNLLLFRILIREFGPEFFEFGPFARMMGKLLAATLLAGAALWGSKEILSSIHFATALTNVLCGGIVFSVVFLASGAILRMEEAKLLLTRVLRLK